MRKSTIKQTLAAWLITAALPVFADTELTLPQARAIAAQSVQTDPALAAQLARGVLQGQPKDGVSHFILAQAYLNLGKPDLARAPARKAFRYAQSDVQKFEAAQLAAKLAFQSGSPTTAQVWLRRSAIYAPTEQAEKLVASDYRQLRQINPWSFYLRGGISPSDNVNNGTDNDVLTQDGVPTGGLVSGSGQALSGVEANVDATIGYRLRANKDSATHWNTRIYLKEVKLSGEARALSPSSTDNDFAYAVFDTGLRHAFRIGEAGTTAAVSFNMGQTWAASNPYTRYSRLKGELGYLLSDQTRLSFSAAITDLTRVSNRNFDSVSFDVTAGVTQKLQNGDTAGLSLFLSDSASDAGNAEYEYAALRASYAFGKPIGPVSLRAGLTYTYRHFDAYAIGFSGGERTDKGLSADITMVFNDVSYAGFVPSLTLRAQSTDSNFSRFETKGLSVAMGIQSKF